MIKPKVAILLSTYNGSKYILEQLSSLNSQVDVSVDIFIRDDGSNDDTISLIKLYAKGRNNVFIFKNNNVGVTHSFFNLLQLTEVKAYDYYAFCDQDDVWLNSKLATMIAVLDNNKPCLVCCSYTVTDDSLNKIRDVVCNEDVALGRVLVDSSYPGCTMIFNQKLFGLIINSLNNPIAWKASIHDMWVLMIATVFGEVKVTNKTGILYRQHNNNAIGASTSFLSRLNRSIKSTVKMRNKHSYIDDAIVFHHVFRNDKIPEYAKKILEDAVLSGGGLPSRLKMILSGRIYKKGMFHNFYFKLRVLFHFYKIHFNKTNLS